MALGCFLYLAFQLFIFIGTSSLYCIVIFNFNFSCPCRQPLFSPKFVPDGTMVTTYSEGQWMSYLAGRTSQGASQTLSCCCCTQTTIPIAPWKLHFQIFNVCIIFLSIELVLCKLCKMFMHTAAKLINS